MAKKTAKAKGAKKPAAKGAKKGALKQTRRQAEQVLTDGPIRKRPGGSRGTLEKQTLLPGTEQFTDPQLDRLAAGVAEERNKRAESLASEKGLLQAVHARMRQRQRTIFAAHGVEFVRAEGEEKLKVRMTKGGDKGGSTAPLTETVEDHEDSSGGADEIAAMDQDEDVVDDAVAQ